jgi:polyketide synthase PksN
MVMANANCLDDREVTYQHEKRLVRKLKEVSVVKGEQSDLVIAWKDNGVYLITGGMGGLGRIFATNIAKRCKNPTLVIAGRSQLNDEMKKAIDHLQALGAKVDYQAIDVSLAESVNQLISYIKQKHGTLHGIIHAAGIIRDNFILKKSRDEFASVLAPKVAGVVHLDEATKEIADLEHIVIFSALAGILGNSGQADYATANAFMDNYARYRNDLVKEKKRYGKTLSINWPLWQEGGMHVDAASEEMLERLFGMRPISIEMGIKAFNQIVVSDKPQFLVIYGQLKKIREKLIDVSHKISTLPLSSPSEIIDTKALIEKIQQKLILMISHLLQVNSKEIALDTELSEYGFDSISLTTFANQINLEFKLELSPTIFF